MTALSPNVPTVPGSTADPVDQVFVDVICADEEWLAAEFAAIVGGCGDEIHSSVRLLPDACPGRPARLGPLARALGALVVDVVRTGLRIGRERAPPRA